MAGWVPLHRSLLLRDDWLAPSKRDPACNGYAWAWLFGMAQTGQHFHASLRLERGEIVVSVRGFARRMGWSKSRANRFMLRLASETMIETVRETPQGTVYRIVNYDTYAGTMNPERDSQRDTERDASGTHAGHMRDKNNKEQRTIPTTTAREPVIWPDETKRRIAALYGLGREGTDERVWKGLEDPDDHDERRRIARIAAARLQDEGRSYNARQYRRTLLAVVAEQNGTPDLGRSNVSGAVTRLFGDASA